MIEIIPNWHPTFVHFTVALFTTSVVCYWFNRLLSGRKISEDLLIVARWTLWLAVLISMATIGFGFYAYYTVAHDEISHLAMTDHRNWALVTFAAILIMAMWSWYLHRAKKKTGYFFLSSLLIVFALLASTAWRGGELVYRYGTGVMSLPKAEVGGHAHEHSSKQKPHLEHGDHKH